MEFIRSLLGSISTTASNVIVYIAIVAMFVVGIICCIIPVVHTRARLRRAVRSIKAGQKSKNSWQDDDFLGKGALMAHWSAYLNNLFFAEGKYHNPSNVEDFINEETVIYGPGRAAFADALPTVLVSLGFLGTLIGLSQGLAGFNMTDSAAAQDSIMTLIPGMRYAFMTSIFGVIGSVLFTLVTRAVYGSTEKALRSFYGAMSRYAGVLNVDPLTQVAIYQQEQTALIQTMAKDLNGKFTENMTSAIQSAVEPINQSLKNFMAVTSKEQMRFLDQVVVRFVDRLDDTMAGRLQDFGRTLEATNHSQQEAFAAIRTGISETEQSVRDLRSVQRIAKDMVDNMSGYLDDLRASAARAQAGYDKLGGAVERMDGVVAQQNNYLKTVAAMQAEITRSVETMTGAVSQFTKKFAEENAAAAGAMGRAAEDLRATGASLEAIQKKTSAAFEEELRSTLDAYRDYVNQFTQRVDYLASSISDSLSQMPRAVGETSDQFLDQVDRLTRTLDQAQRALNDAVDRLYSR